MGSTQILAGATGERRGRGDGGEQETEEERRWGGGSEGERKEDEEEGGLGTMLWGTSTTHDYSRSCSLLHSH